jgi:hypothetical protein
MNTVVSVKVGLPKRFARRGGASFPKGIIDNPARLLLRHVPNSYRSGP